MGDAAPMSNERQIVLRVPAEIPARAESLAERMKALPALAGMRVTPSSVLRQALLRGLESLEAEAPSAQGAARKSRKKR
jgi:hypothetical protein